MMIYWAQNCHQLVPQSINAKKQKRLTKFRQPFSLEDFKTTFLFH